MRRLLLVKSVLAELESSRSGCIICIPLVHKPCLKRPSSLLIANHGLALTLWRPRGFSLSFRVLSISLG